MTMASAGATVKIAVLSAIRLSSLLFDKIRCYYSINQKKDKTRMRGPVLVKKYPVKGRVGSVDKLECCEAHVDGEEQNALPA